MGRSQRFRVCPRGLHARFRLAFAPAPALKALASPARSNSPDHNAKGTQSPQEQPKLPPRLLPLVGTRFQVLFHSPPGVLFTFPSRYSCTIGRGRVFSLGGWSPQIQPELLGSSGLLGYQCHPRMSTPPTGLSPSPAGRSRPLRVTDMSEAGYPRTGPTTPTPQGGRFGLLPFRSPLLRESRLISSPPGTEMFQFPGLASRTSRDDRA
jgi:hypothetical protein